MGFMYSSDGCVGGILSCRRFMFTCVLVNNNNTTLPHHQPTPTVTQPTQHHHHHHHHYMSPSIIKLPTHTSNLSKLHLTKTHCTFKKSGQY